MVIPHCFLELQKKPSQEAQLANAETLHSYSRFPMLFQTQQRTSESQRAELKGTGT